MQRRSALKLLSTGILASNVDLVKGQLFQIANTPATYGLQFLNPAQNEQVVALTETIIPADSHSGGAKAAKVADYIDKTLRETTDDNKKALWRECLPLIDSMSQHYTGKSFVAASPEERISVLTVLSDNDHITDVPEVRFFHELKRMTVEGYYTTKIGIHDELEYKGNRILQEFVGCDDQGPAAT